MTSPTSPTSPTELLYADFASEHASTRRMLERYPDGKGEWRPHEKSRPLAALATHVADIVNRGTTLLETDGLDMTTRMPVVPIDSARALLDFFDANVTRFTNALAGADLDALARPWALRRGGIVIIELPKRILMRTMMMSHLVHHRAQLGVYYRLMGIPVPGAYGPSADEMLS